MLNLFFRIPKISFQPQIKNNKKHCSTKNNFQTNIFQKKQFTKKQKYVHRPSAATQTFSSTYWRFIVHCKTQAKLAIMNLPAFCEIFRRFRRGVVEGMFGGVQKGFTGACLHILDQNDRLAPHSIGLCRGYSGYGMNPL